MLTVYINKKKFFVKDNTNVLQFCLSMNYNIPYFCWHPALGSIGSCRQCMVKIYKDKKDNQGFLSIACMTTITDKMHIDLKDLEAIKFQKNIIELLMTNHPHDCPICSEGGNCHLQDMTVLNKHSLRRYTFKKRIYSSQFLGSYLNHEMNRCITCYRCVRYYADYAGGTDFGVYGISNKIYFGRLKDGELESEYSGNLIDICPTGVFTEKNDKSLFVRKWDIQFSPSICHHCSIGCNISVGERFGKLCKIDNRFHKDINTFFLCDLGRFSYHYSNIESRPFIPLHKKHNKTNFLKFFDIIKKINNIFSNSSGGVFGIGSERASIESNAALRLLVGKKFFSSGMPENLNKCIDFINYVLKNYPCFTTSLNEIENHDCILIIGEDISQTASRAALSVRQAINKFSLHKDGKINIPDWNSYAIKNVQQNKKNFLYILSTYETKLDDISTWMYRANLYEQVEFSNLILDFIRKKKPISFLKKKTILSNQAYEIFKNLSTAKNPLIISGASNHCLPILQISFNIAVALKENGKNVGLSLFPTACNSLGVNLFNGISLEKIFEKIKKNNLSTLIILENNLFRNFTKDKIFSIFKTIKNIIVLDHHHNNMTQYSNYLLPSANLYESTGTIINYEARSQKFFKTYIPEFYNYNTCILESWKWIEAISDNKTSLSDIRNYPLNIFLKKIVLAFPFLKEILLSSYNFQNRICGKKIARSSHRFSGRTAILAKRSIHEIKQPDDIDSIFTFSMEGLQNFEKKISCVPFNWSPGWNSNQSLFKEKIYNNNKQNMSKIKNINFDNKILDKKKYEIIQYEYFNTKFIKKEKKLSFLVIPVFKLLASEEMCQYSFNIKKSLKKVCGILNSLDANFLKITDGEIIQFKYNLFFFEIPFLVSDKLRSGLIGLPIGIHNLPTVLINKIVTYVKKVSYVS